MALKNTFDNGLFDSALFDTPDTPAAPPPPPIVFVPPTPGVPVQYQVRLFDPQTGLQVAVLDDWNSLYYYNRVNDFGYHTLSFSGDDPRRALFITDAIIEVWRRNLSLGIPWYRDYVGLHRTSQDQITDRGDKLYTSYGRGPEDLIHRRAILYFAGSPQDTKSGPLDDVMKAYVRENAGATAVPGNGRLRDGTTLGLSIGVDAGLASTWAGSQAWKNLLTVVQEIAQSVAIDFFVTRTGPTTWLFDTAVPRRGTNRTGSATGVAPVVFSLAHDNMGAPYGVVSRTDEANVVIVLGSGVDTNRTYSVRTDMTAASDSPWNVGEKVLDQRNITDPLALAIAGDNQLRAGRATRTISFTALDTLGLAYGRDFFLGDLVVEQFVGLQDYKKVVGVEITVASGKEDLRFHFDTEVGS